MGEIKKRKLGERNKKGELVWDELIPWLLALMVLALVIIVYMILSGKGQGYIDYIKDVLRLGR